MIDELTIIERITTAFENDMSSRQMQVPPTTVQTVDEEAEVLPTVTVDEQNIPMRMRVATSDKSLELIRHETMLASTRCQRSSEQVRRDSAQALIR